MRFLPILALAAGVSGLSAADFESWHTFDFVPFSGGRFDLTLDTHVRTQSRFGEVGQVRFGPVARYTVHSHVRLSGGYYYRDQEDHRRDWNDGHRVFFGMENPFDAGRFRVQSRVHIERFFGAPSAPYNRFRHRVRVSRAGRVEPYALFEYFFVGEGLQILRYAAGAQRRLPKGARLDIGYQYDNFHIGRDRQALLTTVRLDIARHH